MTGKLAEVSIQGASFKPNDPAQTADLKRDQEIDTCSLRVGTQIISVICRVTRNKGDIGLQFKSFEIGGHHILFDYIQNHAERELKVSVAHEK